MAVEVRAAQWAVGGDGTRTVRRARPARGADPCERVDGSGGEARDRDGGGVLVTAAAEDRADGARGGRTVVRHEWPRTAQDGNVFAGRGVGCRNGALGPAAIRLGSRGACLAVVAAVGWCEIRDGRCYGCAGWAADRSAPRRASRFARNPRIPLRSETKAG